MKILPKSERLGDNRVPRELSNAPRFKKLRRNNSALAVQQWKDLKKDKRFALCALAATYDKLGMYLPHCVSAPLHRLDFAPHKEIPHFAYTNAAAHPSQTDAGKIACYPTFGDAKRGREIVMAPGRFFAAIYPDASPSYVQQLAEKYLCSVTPATVHFGDDEEDFARVYRSARGFSSCMAGEFDGDEEHNPVRFYAHDDNDLAIAYLTHNNKPRGETVARSIVNTEKKLYVRVYGDARLATLLEDAGYRHDGQRALSGQKCRARTNYDGRLVAPYLDAIQLIAWDGRSDTCRISSDGSYDATNTDGTAGDDERSTCENCGDRMHEDDSHYSDVDEVSLCSCCADNNYTFAIYTRSGNETYVRNDSVIEVGGTYYLDDADILSAHNLVCDDDGEWQELDDCIYLEHLNEYVLVGNCTELDIPFGEDNYARDNETKIVHVDGEKKTVHEDWEDEEGITDEWKEENPEECEEEDAGKFPAAHARPDDSTARLIETINSECGCNAAMIEERARLDETCRLFTAFRSFDELLNAVCYRPSIDVSVPRLFALANAYDDVQMSRGDSRRAYRYGVAATIETENQETA